ncbi:hypothetical protein Pmani_038413 [Petrolisthes manimaculis]|uniref:BHLH domain-containing protein n=1 Tax=Petrolisthes manimaculis TaxID=1843537 RepID=A0AAE1NFS0_9EUCA|nr:hypothetical protein Pmani_038413 [Petrolisthes manimaculis]
MREGGVEERVGVSESLPRRRSHSSGGSSSSNSTNNSGNVVVGASSLSPHQVITTLPITSLPVTSLTVTSIPISTLPVTSLPLSPATSLPHIAPAPSTTLPHIAPASSLPHIAPATSTATSTSNFLAQLLNSGTYQVSSSDGGGQLGTLKTNLMAITNNNVKVPLVLPAEVVTSNSTSGSSSSSSSSSSGTGSSIKPVVTTALVAPPITLNAVTPSILKSEHSFSQAMSTWSPSFPHGTSKQSPPHQEPSSPLMVNIPSPPNKAFRVKSETDRVQYKEHRRVCHINAEQKRRSNLKSNFDVLHQLVPSISQNSNAKISKALMLQKGAEYIHQLKSERQQLTEKADQLRAEIEALSNDISNSQAQLPATGAPMTHARYSKLKEMFVVYVRERTLASWKFYIFSLITEPLLESFNSSVSTSCLDDLCRSSLAWLDQQCSLNVLRPYVSSAMRKLSTTTSVLADPESLPEEVYRSVTKQETDRYHPSSMLTYSQAQYILPPVAIDPQHWFTSPSKQWERHLLTMLINATKSSQWGRRTSHHRHPTGPRVHFHTAVTAAAESEPHTSCSYT